MKRFNYDENDEEPDFFSDAPDDDEIEDEMADEDYIAMMEQRTAVDLMQLDLVQSDLNQKLLFKTIKMLEKSWLWKFKSGTTKLKMIAETYYVLKQIVQTNQQREMEKKEE